MRVRFRISIYEGDRKLRRTDFSGKRDPLSVALRYITEFKYLEATKWLLVAKDCWEKYVLLALINISFGQEEQARDFISMGVNMSRETGYNFVVENPERGIRKEVGSIEELMHL